MIILYFLLKNRKSLAEATTFQEQIAQGVKLKSIPNIEKEKTPVRLIPVSNNIQLQIAIGMRNDLQSIYSNESKEDDDSF